MRLLFSILLFCCTPVFAAAPEPDDSEAPVKGWVETEAALPPFPKPAGLVEFAVSGATSNRFLLDADSVSIGTDGVVRYALVVRSAGGAENVSFEGIRCATREQKFYAFGQRNGTWSRVKEAQWRAIEYKDANRQHSVLFADFLCPNAPNVPRAPRDIVQRLRYGSR